jgi:hypothetical protein
MLVHLTCIQQKLQKYSEFGCHEVAFWIYNKDKSFFDENILPYLKNKKEVSTRGKNETGSPPSTPFFILILFPENVYGRIFRGNGFSEISRSLEIHRIKFARKDIASTKITKSQGKNPEEHFGEP